MTNKKHKTAVPFETREPVNVDRLRDLASRRASGNVCWPGWDVSIRTVIQAYLGHLGADGMLQVTWREGGSLTDFGFATRRYAGGGEGVAGRSLFCLPRVLRGCGRHGLWNTVDIDQDNSHFQAQLARHPGRPALLKYVRERDATLALVVEATGGTRDDAKVLYLQLAYGGAAASWCSDRGVDLNALPRFVHEFAREQEEIRAEDAEKHPELIAKIRAQGGDKRPEVSLQSQLNMRREREVLDAMCNAVRGIAEIGAYEHDGLFLYNPRIAPDDEAGGRAWRDQVVTRVKSQVAAPVSIKEPMSFDDALADLRARWPDEDWDSVDTEDVLSQGALIQEALRLGTKTSMHHLYARIVALEAQAYPDHPFSVRELFKHRGSGQYWCWDVTKKQWVTEDGRDKLLNVICDVLGRRVRAWSMEFAEEGCMTTQLIEASPQFLCVSLAESVEKLVRSCLRDQTFQLDGDDMRRYLVFDNAVFDRDEDEILERTPAIRSTHSTGWRLEESGLSDEQEQALVDALMLTGVDDAILSDEACSALDSCAKFIPAMAFLQSICGSWERTLYCAKHLARATFALPYQEHLWTRGPGANGKDTLANLMLSLLGGYFANLPCEALTGGREMDAPSQTMLALRGKRFVAVREIARNAKIRSHIYKTIADPKGKLKARGLYGQDTEFPPHFLLYLASNVPVDIDDSSGGSARRTRILDLPFNFVETPQAANEKQKDANLEAQFASWRPSLFFLLCQVYARFLRVRNQTNVTPVPQEVSEAVEEELEEDWMRKLVEFTRDRLEPAARSKDATSAADIRQAFFDFCCGEVPKKEVGLRLARKGFAEENAHFRNGLTRTSRRVYKVKLESGVSFVMLLSVGSTGGS
jgi:hypothetical protein